MPRCQLIGGLHCAVTPSCPSATEARPRGLAVCFGVCEATWCGAPGDVPAGEIHARQTSPGFSTHLLPTGRGGRQRRQTNNCSIGKLSSCRRPSRWHEWRGTQSPQFAATHPRQCRVGGAYRTDTCW